jgi:hypothetical protein
MAKPFRVQRERLPTAKYFDRWPMAQVGTTTGTSHTGKERKPTAQYKAHGLWKGGMCKIVHGFFFVTM